VVFVLGHKIIFHTSPSKEEEEEAGINIFHQSTILICYPQFLTLELIRYHRQPKKFYRNVTTQVLQQKIWRSVQRKQRVAAHASQSQLSVEAYLAAHKHENCNQILEYLILYEYWQRTRALRTHPPFLLYTETHKTCFHGKTYIHIQN
jgi:hypothetical protein